MADYFDEEAQVEALRRWWLENWKALVAGLVIGLIAILGWQGWIRHQAAHRAQAARMYSDLQQAMQGSKDSDVHAIAARLTHDYDNTPYAAMAELKLAQADVSHARYAAAAERLRWVAEHGPDDGTRAVGRLRLAAVLWQLGKDDDALAEISRPPPAFVALYAELRGDIEYSRDKREQARKEYQQALQALPADSPERQALQEKLGELATGAGAA